MDELDGWVLVGAVVLAVLVRWGLVWAMLRWF
jgi:hypothetical protein